MYEYIWGAIAGYNTGLLLPNPSSWRTHRLVSSLDISGPILVCCLMRASISLHNLQTANTIWWALRLSLVLFSFVMQGKAGALSPPLLVMYVTGQVVSVELLLMTVRQQRVLVHSSSWSDRTSYWDRIGIKFYCLHLGKLILQIMANTFSPF